MKQYLIENNQEILHALAQIFPDSSKESLRSWIKQGRIFLDGRLVTNSRQTIQAGQHIGIGKKQVFLDKDTKVVFENRHFIVIDKPCGLLSVADDGGHKENLHSILKLKRPEKKIYVIHRLDRETSGLIIFAFTQTSADKLKAALEKRLIKREYRAIIEGKPKDYSGKWQSFLSEDKHFFVHSSQDPRKGKKATSCYQCLASSDSYTYLKITLETGRKNQIRAQCLENKHPIAGDRKYGAKKNPIGRLALHAHTLNFSDPQSGKPLSFCSPVPEIFFKAIDRMQIIDLKQ